MTVSLLSWSTLSNLRIRSFASSDTPYENDRIDYYDYTDNDTGINCDDNDGGHDDRGVVMLMA